MEAQQTAVEGRLRLRHIDYDAAPEGRAIRRTAPYRWWLVATGRLYATLNGGPIGYAIERGALIADPLLLALMLLAGAAYTARYLGSFAAVGFGIGGMALFPLTANFQPGAPDPHSLSWALALGSILPLLAAVRRAGSKPRSHFALAGVFGGLGLWTDASTQMPVLLAVCLGAVAYELFRARRATEPSTLPSSWGTWSLAGALTTLAGSLFEFAPNEFSWSLDSVNPIHAFVWLGMGGVLRAAGIWAREGRKGLDRRALALLGGGALAIAAWPVVGGISGSGALLASDFYALELANHPDAGFAPSLTAWLNRDEGSGAKWATLLPCALLVVLLGRMFNGTSGREARARLAFVFVTALFAVVLAHAQLRWWNLFDVFALAALAALFAEAASGGLRGRARAVGASLLALPGLFVGFPPEVEGDKVEDLSPMEAQALIARDFSYWLAKRGMSEPVVLFSTPVFSTAAAFYGGFDVVVSSDDENETGNLTAIRIASAMTAQEVSILLRSRGITHVALPLWDPMLDHLVRVGMNLPAGQELPPGAFSVALRQWDIPLWMRPMDYLIPREPGFEGYELRTFGLQAEQEPDLGLSRLADFFVERGQLREALSLRESLKAYPRSVVALGAIASIDLARRDGARLEESLEALMPYLSRRGARNLPVDRRISLAALLLQTKRVDEARAQAAAAFEALDVETLKALMPGAVVRLVVLSRSFDIPFPDRELEALALELIPPGVRARLTQTR